MCVCDPWNLIKTVYMAGLGACIYMGHLAVATPPKKMTASPTASIPGSLFSASISLKKSAPFCWKSSCFQNSLYRLLLCRKITSLISMVTRKKGSLADAYEISEHSYGECPMT